MPRRKKHSPMNLDGKVVPYDDGTGKIRFRIDYIDEDGKRRREIVSADEREAWMILADRLRERDQRREGVQAVPDLSVEELMRQYLVHQSMNTRPSHFRNLQRLLPRVLGQLDVRRPQQLNISLMNEYRRRRISDSRANATVNRDVSAVKAMLNWAVQVQLLISNPLDGLRRLPEGRGHQTRPRRPMTEDEVVRFLEAARAIDRERGDYFAARKTIAGGSKGSSYPARRRRRYVPQWYLWFTMLWTGGRLGELSALRWSDVDLGRKLVTFREEYTKSGKLRRVPISEELLQELRGLWKTQERVLGRAPRSGELVFLSPEGRGAQDQANASHRYHVILERAEVTKIVDGLSMTIHSLRHTFCTRLARAGVPLLDAQKLMGHSDPKLTAEIYSHVTPEDLRPSMERLPPLLGGDEGTTIKEGTILVDWGAGRWTRIEGTLDPRIRCVA